METHWCPCDSSSHTFQSSCRGPRPCQPISACLRTPSRQTAVASRPAAIRSQRDGGTQWSKHFTSSRTLKFLRLSSVRAPVCRSLGCIGNQLISLQRAVNTTTSLYVDPSINAIVLPSGATANWYISLYGKRRSGQAGFPSSG